MKIQTSLLGWLVAVVLGVVIVFMLRECVHPAASNSPLPALSLKGDSKYTSVKTIEHDTVIDTFLLPGKDVIKYVAQPIPVLPAKADTDSTLKDYFAFRIYHLHTHSNDVDIEQLDTLQRNKIYSQTLSIKNNRPDSATIAKAFKKLASAPIAKNKWFIGLNVTAPFIQGTGAGANANISLLTKSDHFYSIGYDPFNKSASFGTAWKIHFGK